MIVAVGGLKGGIGKSTVAINLAATAFDRGRSVLLVDADPTATTQTWADVAAEAGIEGPTVVRMGVQMSKPGQLLRAAESYELTVVDCPPQDDKMQRSALSIADLVLLPCAPSVAEAWALALTAKLIADTETMRETLGLPPLRVFVVVNRKKPKTAIGKGVRDVLKQAGLPLLHSELYDRVTYTEFLASGRGIVRYRPSSLAAREVTRLADEVEQIASA